jgi:DNA mismatch endonuclease (patch repair protein)
MPDTLTRAQRSHCMSRIRSKDTRPELAVRRIVHRLGYRFRLHVRDLPGAPDLVFPRLRKIVLVHGCFWHMHCCRFGLVTPKTNAEFWQAKRSGNVIRDRRNERALRKLGWDVLVVWECETKALNALIRKLVRFLGPAIQKRRHG